MYILLYEVVITLTNKCYQAHHVNFRKVRHVVEEEIGCPIKERFALFAEEPLAAASLAQVHRAVLRDGTRVVVKVQYPHSYQRFMADVWLMARFVDLVEMVCVFW